MLIPLAKGWSKFPVGRVYLKRELDHPLGRLSFDDVKVYSGNVAGLIAVDIN